MHYIISHDPQSSACRNDHSRTLYVDDGVRICYVAVNKSKMYRPCVYIRYLDVEHPTHSTVQSSICRCLSVIRTLYVRNAFVNKGYF